MEQIIELDPQDNIATIRDRLDHAQVSEVQLVVPTGLADLRNKVYLNLLKRKAQDKAIDLVLVVRDPEIRILAKEVGLPVTASVARGHHLHLKRGKRPKAAPAATSPGQMARQNSALASLNRQPSALARMISLLMVLGVLAALAFGFVLLVLPTASVTLTPATQAVEAQIEITAMPDLQGIDYERGQVPARVLSIELETSGSTPATGKRDVADAHAEGEVVFSNKTDQPVIVPRGTIVRSTAGAPIRFYTVAEAELPGRRAAYTTVPIIAVDPGPTGNVRASTINTVEGELALQIDVINVQATRGGGLKQISEITSEDRARLKNTLLQRIQQEALSRLQAEIGGTEFIPADTVAVKVASENYDHAAGDVADMLSLTLKVVAQALVVGGEDANALVLSMLESNLPAGYVLYPDSVRYEPPEQLSVEGSTVRFLMRASGVAWAEIDKAAVLSGIMGKPESEALAFLSEQWEYSQPPRLETEPEWLGRVPWAPYRITINIETPAEP